MVGRPERICCVMDTIIHAGISCYRVVWAKDRRMVKLCEKLLCGLPVNHRSGRYRYALFCNGSGFSVKRKECSVPDWEQTWVCVCEVDPVL